MGLLSASGRGAGRGSSGKSSGAVGIVSPLLGGVVAARYGYPALVWLAVGFQALAFATTWRFVDEPRHRDAA